jgi:multisubunit Na+/H+ antiporter MnhB subunit
MKIIVALLGILISELFCFIVFSFVSDYQESQLNYTPSSSDNLIDTFIIITPFVAIFGGWISILIYNQYLTKKSS